MSDDWELYEDDFDDAEAPRPKKKTRKNRSEDAAPAAVPDQSVSERTSGRVASMTRLDVTTLTPQGLIETAPLRESNGHLIRLAVGDEVLLARRGDAWKLESVSPRRSRLSRPDPHDPTVERTFAANVDVAILVLSVRQPPLRIGLADRFIIACERGGVRPVLAINKSDLAPDEDLPELERYRAMDIPTIRTSVKSGEGIDTLVDAIRTRTAVLVGHSGVGKSSLLKTLLGRLGAGAGHEIRTGEVNQKAGVGRHTTTASTLYEIGDGTWIIDTPGVRQFGLWDLSPALLLASFPDIAELAAGCHFNDCTHSHEPDCAVQEAVDEGKLDDARFETYLRLLEEVSGGSP